MKNTEYAEPWEDYRRRIRWFFVTWFGGFLVSALFATVLTQNLGVAWAPAVVGALWLAVCVSAAFRVQRFRCPRCDNPFFKATWYYWPFARSCVHCGLRKWQP